MDGKPDADKVMQAIDVFGIGYLVFDDSGAGAGRLPSPDCALVVEVDDDDEPLDVVVRDGAGAGSCEPVAPLPVATAG